MATINELQDEVVEEFQDFTDWMDKYQMLIDLGNELAPLDEIQERAEPYRRLPEPRMAAMRLCRWQARIHSRQRCAHRKGHHRPPHPCVERSYPNRDYGCRPLFRREDWSERSFESNPQQRSSGDDRADSHVRPCLQDQEAEA